MSTILTHWLNEDVRLSTRVDAANFGREFASGYLLGEILQKYGLQSDFNLFSKSRSANSKLNNFTRLEPTMHILGIPFDTNVAHSVMTEKFEASTRLLYQMFIALNKKQKANLTGTAMETMLPSAPMKLHGVETVIYSKEDLARRPPYILHQFSPTSSKKMKHRKRSPGGKAKRKTQKKKARQSPVKSILKKREIRRLTDIVRETRLKEMTPRQTDLDLQEVTNRFHQKKIEMEQIAFRERLEEETRHETELQDKRQDQLTKYKQQVQRKTEMLARIRGDQEALWLKPEQLEDIYRQKGFIMQRAEEVKIPQPPAKVLKAMEEQKQKRAVQEAEQAYTALSEFDERLKYMVPMKDRGSGDDAAEEQQKVKVFYPNPAANEGYINELQQRTLELTISRSEREKRRRKVFMDQLKAHEVNEELKREEMLVQRLMRQSQQERRIAVEMLNSRKEKDNIRENRIYREKQYQARRLKEFHLAMNRERHKARQLKLEYTEQTLKDRELHDRLSAEAAEARYSRHYNHCAGILKDIVDFSLRCSEYRELTNCLVPSKMFREWKELFYKGYPLYEQAWEPVESDEPTPEQILEEERQKVLDETDFTEYKQMIGDWALPESCELALAPPAENNIIGFVIHRLYQLNHPPTPPPPPPEFPPFPIKACVVGKSFCGKTTALQKIAQSHRMKVLVFEDLLDEALNSFNNNEMAEEDELIEEMLEPELEHTVSDENKTDTHDGSKEAGENGQVSVDPTIRTDNDGETLRGSDDPLESARTPAVDEVEKTDPEKPVPDDEQPPESRATGKLSKNSRRGSQKPEQQTPVKPVLSDRALLGAKAAKLLKKGKALDDTLMVEVIAEAIKRLPEGTGWALDGFPSTLNQAKALEKAFLPPSDAASRENSKGDLKGKTPKSKTRPSLVQNPKAPPPPPEPDSGINAIILLDTPDDLCLRRAVGRTRSSQTQEQFQHEFKPPPEGSATGVGTEKVQPVEDAAHDQEQLQNRLTAFAEAWPKIDKFYAKYNNIFVVDGSLEAESVYLELENQMEQVIKKVQGPSEEELQIQEALRIQAEQEEARLKAEADAEKQKELEAAAQLLAQQQAEKEEEDGAGTPAVSRKGSLKRKDSGGSKEDKRSRKTSEKRDSSAGKDGKKGGKPDSGKGGKKGKTPEIEHEPEPEAPPGTPPPEPGTNSWVFVELELPQEVYAFLGPYWDTVEDTYLQHSKCVFRKIRNERELIIRYYYTIRQEYIKYLKRPDLKQEYVASWQKTFNEMHPDMRDDEETRAELHQSVDDLKEQLWSICDQRKEAAEAQRSALMKDSWLDDHTAILANHYVTEMQAEVDRFQDTFKLLRDYYRAMAGHSPDEQNTEFARIPLIDIPQAVEEQEEPVAQEEKAGTPQLDEPKLSTMKSVSSKSSKNPQEEQDRTSIRMTVIAVPMSKSTSRIPLVPRRPVSPDLNAQAKAKEKKPSVKGKEEEVIAIPQDPDDRLVFEAYQTAVTAIDKLVAAEQVARDAEVAAAEEAERLKEEEKARAAAAAAKANKKDKKGKGKDSAKNDEENVEEKERKKEIDRGFKEFFVALHKEVDATRTRLQLIRCVACNVITELKKKAEQIFVDMNDWLGARFLKEMESIDHLSEVARHAVESGSSIKEQLILQQDDFLLDVDYKTLRSPSPPPRPPPMEPAQPDLFTVDQIRELYKQFRKVAPGGLMALNAFTETFLSLMSLSFGTDDVPIFWSQITYEKVEQLAREMSADGEYIDWRSFIISAAHPWPSPSQFELLKTLETFRQMDQQETGFVTQEQFDRMQLWFPTVDKVETPEDPSAPYPYHRLTHLKNAMFDVFADFTTEPPLLDYVYFLMYFARARSPYLGFLRALSVLTGKPLARIPLDNMQKGSRPSSTHSLVDSQGIPREHTELSELQSDIVADDAINTEVTLDQLLRTLEHGLHMRGDSHRFSSLSEPDDIPLRERLEGIFQEITGETNVPMNFATLLEHPIVQEMIQGCQRHKTVDVKSILFTPDEVSIEVVSSKTGE